MSLAAVSGATTVVGVMGTPVKHSLSPRIHNAAFVEAGLDWVCVAFETPEGHAGEAVRGIRALGIAGMSVTMPHKQAVIRHLDELSPDAAVLDAVNCIVNADGKLIGLNTDGDGFVAGLSHDFGVEAQSQRCAIIGAGGAARSVILALARHGASEIAIINRTESKSVAAAALSPAAFVGSQADIENADLVINATSIGMNKPQTGDGSELLYPCDPALLHEGQTVVDLIYSPITTPWLREAANAGAVTSNGISMLVHQAAVAFSAWTGQSAPVEAMSHAVTAHLGDS
ncbi:MAG: shikimate dehydrogenase [Microthrixaceae bacterium]|nr:shikimate dehydrogenase [Microthrixaceae bacterium]